MDDKRLAELADQVYYIIGAAMEVHQELGYGISEGIYEEALAIELDDLGYKVETQCDLPTFYKGILLEKRFRLDVAVDDDIIIELKATEAILPEHRAQLFNYLRLTRRPVGILLNFGKSMACMQRNISMTLKQMTFTTSILRSTPAAVVV